MTALNRRPLLDDHEDLVILDAIKSRTSLRGNLEGVADLVSQLLSHSAFPVVPESTGCVQKPLGIRDVQLEGFDGCGFGFPCHQSPFTAQCHLLTR